MLFVNTPPLAAFLDYIFLMYVKMLRIRSIDEFYKILFKEEEDKGLLI